MALSIHADAEHLQVVAGYESGHTIVFAQAEPGGSWQTVYSAQPHAQPGNTPIHFFHKLKLIEIVQFSPSQSPQTENIISHPQPMPSLPSIPFLSRMQMPTIWTRNP